MHLKQIMKRAVALILALSLLMGLTGCSSAMDTLNSMSAMLAAQLEITPGEPLINSAWINSDLEGSIDETTELNLKDDFHTAVNRDWLLETYAEGDEEISSLSQVDELLQEQLHSLLIAGTPFQADPGVMSQETLDHLLDLIWDMMDLAGNKEKRNELGVEPLRPYLDAIAQIDSLDDLTEYLKNADGMNITGEDFANFSVVIPNNARDFYTVTINYPTHKLMPDYLSYSTMGYGSYEIFEYEKEALNYVLGELGYTPQEIKKLISDCYKFESQFTYLAPHNSDLSDPKYKDRGNKIYTLDDIRDLQGNFPLDELLEAGGVAHSDTFRLLEPGVLNYLGSIYKEKNLDKFKTYFMIHTILDSLPYLDETCREMGVNIEYLKAAAIDPETPKPESDPEYSDPEEAEAARLQALYRDYVSPMLAEPYQLAYIGSYCSSETKREILNLLDDVRDFYIDLMGSTKFLSPATREKAIEKMEKMKFRVLYPDVLTDYSGLIYQGYDDGGNLLDAVAAIGKMHFNPAAEKVNQAVDRGDWNLRTMPTTVVNAYNSTNINSICILAGIMAGDFMYDPDAPIEQNYARLGTVLGHEITHSFDTDGYTLDAEGLPYGWWTNEDEVAFREKSNKLVNYYSSLTILPKDTRLYSGMQVQTEAISDMGGMKCMLALAEEIPDFDYDLFFRFYANVWRSQTSFTTELQRVNYDPHPLHFLRTNVTLQQFEKFYETYDIGPGDGMYLAPEDRVLVW